MTRTEAVEFCVRRLAKQRGLILDGVSAGTDGAVHAKLRRRAHSFTARIIVDSVYGHAQLFDLVYWHVREADIRIRTSELMTVLDIADDDEVHFPHAMSTEKQRQIGIALLRLFVNVVRGDEVLRARVMDIALQVGQHTRIGDLLHFREKEKDIIASMAADECERLALALMARVERLRSVP
jgi:hypothetical protein